MDRQIVYPGAIPLETDLLNTNKNTMIGLSKLASAIIGTATSLNGLACTAHAPANLTVDVAAGEIYSLQNIDGTDYSSLAADTTHQIMKQGIKLDSSNLSCPAPVTAGHSINYLIQVAYQDVDTGMTVLPYYNAANPSTAYSGPANSGTAQATIRSGACIVSAKTGIAAATGTQATPAPDAGFTAAYVVTVANGQSTITSGNISVAPSAPFLSNVSRLMKLQLEVESVILGGGYTPSSASNTQLLAALNLLFTKKTGATGLIRSMTLAGGGIVREWGDVVNAATVGGIEFGFSYNANINLATGAFLGRDIAGPCFLRKLNDTGVSEEIWYAESDLAGTVPVWKCINVIDPAGISNTNVSGKNLLVNGNFDVWQKGPGPFVNWTFAGTYAAGDYGYTADRWACGRAGNVAGMTVSRVAGMTPDATYALKMQRIAGDTSANVMYVDYSFSLNEILGIQGKQISVSLDLKSGANFSAGTSLVGVAVFYGTGAATRIAVGYTGQTGEQQTFAVPAGQTVTRYGGPFSLTVPTNCTQMAIRIFYTPVGTAGANDSLTIGRVQLEIGKATTQFEVRNPIDALQKCMQMYQSFDTTAGVLNLTAPPVGLAGHYGAASAIYTTPMKLGVVMDRVPTVTKVGAWNAVNCSQPSLTANDQYVQLNVTVTALGSFTCNVLTAGLYYTLDARVI